MLVTTGRGFDRRLLGAVPEDTCSSSPGYLRSTVFPFASMVLCHGGSGTTYGALAAGLPIVFVPMFADQRTNAKLITVAGAGVVVDVGLQVRTGLSRDRSRRRRCASVAAVIEVLAQEFVRTRGPR